MQPLGISINALARALAVPANRISGIVNGTRAITADTALRLGKYFGVSPEIWLDLQSDYELRVARQTTWRRRRALGKGPGGVRAWTAAGNSSVRIRSDVARATEPKP